MSLFLLDWTALKKIKIFCLGTEWPALAFIRLSWFSFSLSFLLEHSQVEMFSSLSWFGEELRDERQKKSKNKGKEGFSNPSLLLPKGGPVQKREFSTLVDFVGFLTIFPFLGWFSVALLLDFHDQLCFFSQGDQKEGGKVWDQHHDFWKRTFLTVAKAAFCQLLVFIGRSSSLARILSLPQLEPWNRLIMSFHCLFFPSFLLQSHNLQLEKIKMRWSVLNSAIYLLWNTF